MIKSASECRFDAVSLGEVMLRLDPGEGRIHTTRGFQAWEGGGEYNVARGLRRCFGLRTAIVTALADNPVGRLVEDLMLQGGVDLSYLRWIKYDGVGREVRNGLNFTERGFGPRGGVGCSDRGHTAASQMQPKDVDWAALFGQQGARWLHTGGVFCGLSASTPSVAQAAMQTARSHGTRDLVRSQLPRLALAIHRRSRPGARGEPLADAVRRRAVRQRRGLLGRSRFRARGRRREVQGLPTASFRKMIGSVVQAYPNITTVATTLRTARSASVNGWGAICYHEGAVLRSAADRCGDHGPRGRW